MHFAAGFYRRCLRNRLASSYGEYSSERRKTCTASPHVSRTSFSACLPMMRKTCWSVSFGHCNPHFACPSRSASLAHYTRRYGSRNISSSLLRVTLGVLGRRDRLRAIRASRSVVDEEADSRVEEDRRGDVGRLRRVLVGVEAEVFSATDVDNGDTCRDSAPCIFLRVVGIRVVQVAGDGTSPGAAMTGVVVGLVEDEHGLLRWQPLLLGTRHSIRPRSTRPLLCRKTRRARAGAPRKTAWACPESPSGRWLPERI